MTESDSSTSPIPATHTSEPSGPRPDGDPIVGRVHGRPGATVRYVRAARPFRSLSTGGVVVAGERGASFSLEPGAALLWEILTEPRALDEILGELEGFAQQARTHAVPGQSGGSDGIGGGRGVDVDGSPSPTSDDRRLEAVLPLLHELCTNGIVDVA